MLTPNETVNRFRAAVSAGEFDKAGSVWTDYCKQIEQEIRRGVCTASRMREARELLDWTGGVVRCAQAVALSRINASRVGAQAAAAYARIAHDSSFAAG